MNYAIVNDSRQAELFRFGSGASTAATPCFFNAFPKCISDILAFDRALFGGQLLNEASMEIMLHDDNNYCCGLYSIPGYNHGGNGYTTKTMNTIVPSEDYGHIYVIWMSHM